MLHYECKLPALTLFEIFIFKCSKKHREIFFDCTLKEKVNNTYMQSLVSEPALLPVLLIVEFLNGDFNV